MSGQRGVRIAVVGWLIICSGVLVASCQRKSEETPDQIAAAQKAVDDSLGIILIERGQQAYLASCGMCHGIGGGGDGPLAEELRAQGVTTPARLNDRARLDQLGHEEIVRVIASGGAHAGRSNLMPPWGEKLTPALIDTIADYVMALPDLQPGTPASTVEAYLQAPPGTPEEGRRLYVFYCSSCHGPNGKGDGFLADTLWARNRVRPRDLTDGAYLGRQTDQELFATVSLGGAHAGKSMFMPAWTATLQPGQIRSLVSYLRAISGTPPQP